MNRQWQKQKAERLLALHTRETMLVLPNVWNAIGARVLEKKGYSAVATSSSAIAASLGYRDGEQIRKSTSLDIIARIAHSVDVPVSADVETGYGQTLPELEESAKEFIDSGIAGINVEDSLIGLGRLRPVDEQCRRISAIRQAADRVGVHLVINARIDSYVSPEFGTREEATDEAVMRARAYADAGADCIFPMGPGDEATVRQLRRRITCPLNIVVGPDAAPLPVLQEIGVNRVSFGPFIFRSCLRKFIQIADTLKTTGDYACFSDMLSKTDAGAYLLDGDERQTVPEKTGIGLRRGRT